MTQEDWTKMNKESHYNALQKQDTANRKLIKKLQLEKEELKKQLNIQGVVGSIPNDENIYRRSTLNFKSLNDNLSRQEISETSFISGFDYCYSKLTGNDR